MIRFMFLYLGRVFSAGEEEEEEEEDPHPTSIG
jgi:hypothetical protein